MEKRKFKVSLTLLTIFMIAALAITGCGRRIIEAGEGDEPANLVTDTPKADETPVPGETPAPSPSPAISAGMSEDLVRKFMGEKHKDENMLECFIEDFDRDAFDEAVVSVGSSIDDLSGFYVLRYRDGTIEQVAGLSGNDTGYSIMGIKPVRFDGTDLTYICVELTNWASLRGFAIYEVYGEGVVELFISASATGAGEDALLDLDGDGVYDGFYQRRWSYDVFYYPIYRQFLWIDGLMYPDICDIELPEYPDTIEGVITEYLILSALALEYCPAADERLAMLCPETPDERVADYLRDLYNALQNEVLELEGGLDFEISQKGDSAPVLVSGPDYYGQVHEFNFDVVRKDYGWCIKSIAYIGAP